MKKMLFVYNPRSGKGLIRSHLSAIIEMFSEAGYDICIHATCAEKDACSIVQERASEFDMIVCSGGDGTLDEVVTGVMKSQISVPIGYIPSGSTNDFGNSLGIPKQMEKAANLIVRGETFACDIGKFNDSYFVYVAAFGIFTDVSYQTNQEMKNILGHTAYLIEGMKRVSTWKNYHLKIESEEFSTEGDFMYGMVSNSTSVGGIKGLTGKNVELDDGVFEVMLIRTPQSLMDWQNVIGAVVLQDEGSDHVVRFKTARLKITSDEPVAWTRDGESGGEHTEVELLNMQEAVIFMTEADPERFLTQA